MADTTIDQNALRAAKAAQALQLAAQARQHEGKNEGGKTVPERIYPHEGFQLPIRTPQ